MSDRAKDRASRSNVLAVEVDDETLAWLAMVSEMNRKEPADIAGLVLRAVRVEDEHEHRSDPTLPSLRTPAKLRIVN